jgi:ribonuclease VapC
MALSLKDPEADRLAREVAARTGETLTAAVIVALRERLARLKGSRRTAIVIEARKGEAGGRELDLLIHKADIAVVAVDAGHVAEARRAYRRFGRGHHAARLDFGDVFAYALARASGEALLFKGEDFSKTDVRPAI